MEDQSEDGSDQLDLHVGIEEEVDSFIQPANKEFVEPSDVKALCPSHFDEKNKQPEICNEENTINEENECSLVSYVTTEEKIHDAPINISHDESVSEDFSGFAEEESILDKKVNITIKDALPKNVENTGEVDVGYCSSTSKYSMAKEENTYPVAETSEPRDQFQDTGNKELNNDLIASPKTILDKSYNNFNPSRSGVLEFAGFDSQSIDMSLEKTNKMIQILQYKEEEWTRKEVLGDSAMQNIYFNSVESTSVSETAEQIDILNIGTGDQDSTSTFPEVENVQSLTDELTLNNPPIAFGPHVNIFEEQVPSGSKRVKKKRKFFGDFEDPDAQKSVKKKSIPSPNGSEPKINNILSENKENFMTEDKYALSETEAVNEPQASPVIPSKAKRAFVFDITNPLFREPFKHGWKREICYRNLPEGSKSKTAYVTYFGPQGKKFKTIRQIVEHLPPGSELGFQHFTFSVQRIFTESSPHELIRHVKNRPDINDSLEVPAVNQTQALLDQTKPSSKKKSFHLTPKPAGLIIKKPRYLMKDGANDDESLETPSTTVLTCATPKILIKHPLSVMKSSTPKSKLSSVRKDKKVILTKADTVTKKSVQSNETVDGSFGEGTTTTLSPTLAKNIGDLPMTCSISCPLALGSIPTLQCIICLGLYHFECCGIDASLPIHNYVCKNCRSKSEISSELLLAVSDKCNVQNAVSSRFMSKNTKIVDGVTTWLPSSSTVQLSSRHSSVSIPQSTTQTRTPLLQSILEVDGKRYIIVPKESIVSISPNTNNTYSTAFERQCEGSPIPALSDDCNYMVNSEEVNSGDVLVPVMPSDDDSNSLRNSFVNYERHSSGNRKISEDLEVTCTKAMKLDRESAYHSVLTLNNVIHVYDVLVSCLKYLTVRDLLRVSMSCKYLNRVASESALWSTVRLKNSKVQDWEGFARSLRKYGTKKLDMRKMLCPSSPNDLNAMWNGFLHTVPTVTSLEHIEFGRCSSNTVETVAMNCPNLVIVNAVQLRDGEESRGLFMESFAKLMNLRELRLKGSTGLIMKTGENDVELKCKNVQVLSLTSIKMLNHVTVQAIGNLRNLRILELGECSNELLDQSQMAEPLGKLDNLEKLRLELVTNLDPKFELILALKNLRHLTCLELINVEVKAGFDQALVQLQSLENLFIIPMYKLEAATTNRVMLDCLFGLADRLKICVWGVTMEVLKATMFFAANNECTIKQCEGEKPSLIPVLKHIGAKQSEVELYSLKHVDKILKTRLSNTFSKIISFPFNSSWRQSLSEQVK